MSARILMDTTRTRMVVNSGDTATFRVGGVGTPGPIGVPGPPGGDTGVWYAPDYDVTCNGIDDDYAALSTLLNVTIPDFQSGWGPNNNWDVSGVAPVALPPGGIVRLSEQIVTPSDGDKAFDLFCEAIYGARIVYEGAQTRTDGEMTAGSDLLDGSLFDEDVDPGSDIIVVGAGDGDSDLETWVQEFTDTGQIQLAHPALTSVSGATYILRPSAFRKGDLRSDTRGIPYRFRNIVFQYGGFCYSNASKPIFAEGCAFHETLGPAILALNKDNTIGNPADEGTGSVTIIGRDLFFNKCNGSIHHLAKTAGLSRYENVRTNASMGIPLILRSGYHSVVDADFQGCKPGTPCNIWFPSDADIGGRSDVLNARHGSEVFTEDGQFFEPAYCGVHIGPLSGPVVSVGHNDEEDEYDVPLTRPEQIHIGGGRSNFGGRTGGPTATSGVHAIVINKMTEGLVVGAGVKFSRYYAELISEAWVEANPDTGTSRQTVTGRNYFSPAVNISVAHKAGIFTHGGVDWRPQPIVQTLRSNLEWRNRQNLIPRSNDFANGAWTKTNCSVAKNITGPDGVANSGTTLTRTATGNARVRMTLTSGWVTGEPLVKTIYAKALTHDIMSLGAFATDISGYTQYLGPVAKPINLRSEWDRYDIVCPWVPSTTGIEIAIHHDIVGGGLTSSNLDPGLVGTTIGIAMSQLEVGLAASAYMDNPSSTIVAVMPFQSLPLGMGRLSYGSAAPTTGRHEVGEIVFNTAPAASGTIGWVCVTAGSPGTWKTFGAISA